MSVYRCLFTHRLMGVCVELMLSPWQLNDSRTEVADAVYRVPQACINGLVLAKAFEREEGLNGRDPNGGCPASKRIRNSMALHVICSLPKTY